VSNDSEEHAGGRWWNSRVLRSISFSELRMMREARERAAASPAARPRFQRLSASFSFRCPLLSNLIASEASPDTRIARSTMVPAPNRGGIDS